MKTLLSFHGKQETKDFYLKRVDHHIEMDELVRGEGWENGKGCAVGCTLDAYDHSRYPIELGIPEWLARVEDTLFEGMNLEKSKTWPKKFLESIPIGVDLEQVKVPFIIMILDHALVSMSKTVFDVEKFPEVKSALDGSAAAIKQMIEAQKSGDEKLIAAAESAARSAARSAESAARSAARSAESAAWSAESAARSAESAAWSAARSAESAAWSAAYDYYADELLKMLASAK